MAGFARVRVVEVGNMYEVRRGRLIYAVASTQEEADALARSSWVSMPGFLASNAE